MCFAAQQRALFRPSAAPSYLHKLLYRGFRKCCVARFSHALTALKPSKPLKPWSHPLQLSKAPQPRPRPSCASTAKTSPSGGVGHSGSLGSARPLPSHSFHVFAALDCHLWRSSAATCAPLSHLPGTCQSLTAAPAQPSIHALLKTKRRPLPAPPSPCPFQSFSRVPRYQLLPLPLHAPTYPTF